MRDTTEEARCPGCYRYITGPGANWECSNGARHCSYCDEPLDWSTCVVIHGDEIALQQLVRT